MNIIEHYHNTLDRLHNEKKAATETMAHLAKEDPQEFDRLCELAEETTFVVRNCGKGCFYSWPCHRIFEGKVIDPWPAPKWPKAVLCVEIAKQLI